jgi:NAD(P)-dependent dehydrogenase (short-subunit alcohol dehydrogenase family)
MEIKDRVFIVTGASWGIGVSTAIAMSDRGAKVALLARSTDALTELAQKLPGSLPFTVNMTRFDRVREAVGAVYQHYGRIDGLVNNAGRSYAAFSRCGPNFSSVEAARDHDRGTEQYQPGQSLSHSDLLGLVGTCRMKTPGHD